MKLNTGKCKIMHMKKNNSLLKRSWTSNKLLPLERKSKQINPPNKHHKKPKQKPKSDLNFSQGQKDNCNIRCY